MRSLRYPALLATGLLAFVPACDPVVDDADQITSALEHPNGGLDMEDEPPVFGEESTFVDQAIEPERQYDDPLDSDAAVQDLRGQPGVARLRVMILWGQLPPDRTAQAHDWTGRLTIDRGAMVVRRTIGFEDATDQLAPRTDPRMVAFASITRPFSDGLLLEVIDNAPGSGPMVMHYQGRDGTQRSLDLANLLDGPVTNEIDANGNRMLALAVRHDDVCDHGFVRGRWHALRDNLGVFRGVVSGQDGAPKGHVRGLWGARASGERVFFGKYINLEGGFRGILAGHYGNGDFAGRWLTRAGEYGRVQGHYRESIPGPETGGEFLGRWAETSCASDLPQD